MSVWSTIGNTVEAADFDHFGPEQSDNINRMLTATDDDFILKSSVYNDNTWLITLTVIKSLLLN